MFSRKDVVKDNVGRRSRELLVLTNKTIRRAILTGVEKSLGS